jgi:NAD(P)-dependent dehydrogenase (short-subunit alcohol dehydrogenase family)
MTELGVAGRRAVVFGAGFRPERAGHGRATSMSLARAGARVACVDIDRGRGEAIVDEIRAGGGDAFCVIGDVWDSAQVRQAVLESTRLLGGIDICVDVVGEPMHAPAVDTTDADWDTTLLRNLKHVFVIYREVARQMIRQGTGGSMVAISSVDGLGPSAFHVAYGVAKAGVISLTSTFAEELGPHGIRVNSVAPGNVGNGNWDEPDGAFGANLVNP